MHLGRVFARGASAVARLEVTVPIDGINASQLLLDESIASSPGTGSEI
jgi:hypothetical protein